MGKRILLATLFVLCICIGNVAQGQIITTFAGGDTVSSLNYSGPATGAYLGEPSGIAIDAIGNIYITDVSDGRVLKVNTAGIISTIAGSGIFIGYTGDGGPATAALLNGPISVTTDNEGNVYIGCYAAIRKIDASGIISTFAGNDTPGYSGNGGPATAAEITGAAGMAFDAAGNLYFTDANYIRRIGTDGIVRTIAGTGVVGSPRANGNNGPAIEAELNEPWALLIDKYGNIYEGEGGGGCVRKIDADGIITAVAGTGTGGFGGDNGPATAAQLSTVAGLAFDASGNLYISDDNNERIRRMDTSGTITTYAGTGTIGYNGDGIAATSAELFFPAGIVTDVAGNLYISDQDNGRVRRIIPSTEGVRLIRNTENSLTLYPNPSDGELTLLLSSNVNEPVSVTITNITGEQIKQFTTVTNQPMNMQLDVPPGMYFLTAVTGNGRWCGRVVVNGVGS